MDKTNAGKRVKLIKCDDKFTKLKYGAMGTYEYSMPGPVPGDTQHTIKWDDGSTLMLITPHDAFAFLVAPEIPDHEVRKLHMQVMAVAVRGSGTEDYAIYIGPVPGINKEMEWQAVHSTGCKVSGLDEALVAALFPDWAKKLKYRK